MQNLTSRILYCVRSFLPSFLQLTFRQTVLQHQCSSVAFPLSLLRIGLISGRALFQGEGGKREMAGGLLSLSLHSWVVLYICKDFRDLCLCVQRGGERGGGEGERESPIERARQRQLQRAKRREVGEESRRNFV